jgi:hypothetical protein
MSDVVIPGWNSNGVIPPIDPTNPTSFERSPYEVSLTDLVLRFGTSLERQEVLNGFLLFRSELHKVGLTRGVQWLDGSFLENIESLESRAPNDIDVVTFYHRPNSYTQQELFKASPRLFNHDNVKEDYHVDAYLINLDDNTPEFLVSSSAYWYSVWSHRRNLLWKGYLQIDLSQTHDASAIDNLKCMTNGGTL